MHFQATFSLARILCVGKRHRQYVFFMIFYAQNSFKNRLLFSMDHRNVFAAVQTKRNLLFDIKKCSKSSTIRQLHRLKFVFVEFLHYLCDFVVSQFYCQMSRGKLKASINSYFPCRLFWIHWFCEWDFDNSVPRCMRCTKPARLSFGIAFCCFIFILTKDEFQI